MGQDAGVPFFPAHQIKTTCGSNLQPFDIKRTGLFSSAEKILNFCYLAQIMDTRFGRLSAHSIKVYSIKV